MTSEPTQFICPHCGQALEATPTNFDQTLACPHCHTDLTIPATPVDASSNPFEAEPVSADELDRNRIRQRFALRRALYRSRSYAIIAAVVCAVAVGQLGQSALHAIRGRSFGWAGLYVVVMIVGAFAAIHFYRRAVALHKEASRPMFDESPTTPDFSTLSNGSQVHERLHDVR